MKGEWIREPKGEASVVFVHGILSSGETGWKHESGAYWPEVLKSEEALAAIGIYVYTYQTELFGGNYRLGDVVDDLKENMKLDGLLNCKYIIFVCHSMGGIVVRQFLFDRQSDLIDKNIQIGLFLLGSPSLGSSYANWLAPIAWMAKNAQALALRFSQNNAWLNDLAKNFRNLKEEGKLRIIGKELIEDKPIKLPIVFRIFLRRQIVEPFSAATYFLDSYKVPGSDHFSIAKPVSKDAIQHRLLRQFITDMVIGRSDKKPLQTPIEGKADSEPERPPIIDSAQQPKTKLKPGRVFRDKLKDGSQGPEMGTRARSKSRSDIFISYKREEQPIARNLANALEREGWTVWWDDPKLRAGERFNDVIEKALKESKCVVVMWSKLSVESLYVKDEAMHALNRNKLVPVMIEQLEGIALSHLFQEKVEDLYLGRWTREPGWQATVDDLPSQLPGGFWMCSFREVGSRTLVIVSTVRDISTLRPGDSVTVSGKISGVSRLQSVSLEAAIVSLKPES
jgi:pimeloyl-ACP methyl ester carboxylesterase